MSDEKIVEIMARGVLLNPELTAGSTARSVLAALSAAGYVVVPREPTEAMVEDGRDAYWDYWRDKGDDDWKEHWSKAYAAMISAAEKRDE